MKGIQGFIGDIFWRPLAGGWAMITGLVSILAWHNVGESWPSSMKVLLVVGFSVSALLIYTLYIAYSLYTKVGRPLRVRKPECCINLLRKGSRAP